MINSKIFPGVTDTPDSHLKGRGVEKRGRGKERREGGSVTAVGEGVDAPAYTFPALVTAIVGACTRESKIRTRCIPARAATSRSMHVRSTEF